MTCSYTGGLQSFTYPAGVSEASFSVYGASGGSVTVTSTSAGTVDSGDGGLGGETIGTLTETPGTSVLIEIGQQGASGSDSALSPATYGGGGAGTAGGGGGSFVTSGDGTPLLVAGGGGGGGPSCSGECSTPDTRQEGGSGGGDTGGAGTSNGTPVAGGGTQSDGGHYRYPGGTDGAFEQGASGGIGTQNGGCGGGGGGYYGGAASCATDGHGETGGGGGGSGYTGGAGVDQDTASTASGQHSGDGNVTISYALPPTVTGLSPDSGPTAGGTTVTITGTNFTKTSEVDFGSTPAPSFDVDSQTQITATSPTQAAGSVDVTVTVSDGGTSDMTPADQFTYDKVAPQSLTLAASPQNEAYVGKPVTLTATVIGANGGPTPAGTVDFTGNGNSITSSIGGGSDCDAVPLSTSGQATCTTTSLPEGSDALTAAYSGDDIYTSGNPGTISGYALITDPTITTTVSSAQPKTSYGWYRNPVTITFHCTAGSAPINSSGCPKPMSFRTSGHDSVTRTVTDTDGGTASTTVRVKLDRHKPTVTVGGVKNGHTYRSPRRLVCHARDQAGFSGVASCHLTQHRHHHHGYAIVDYKAVVTDKAGNTRTVTGHYRLV